MKKRFQIVLTLLIMTLALSGCCLQHEWQDATCEAPKTCSKCGKTVGEALGHDWQIGTCLTPKTCLRCGYVEGEAPGHIWMKETCQTPRTCSVCGAVEGEVAEHTWIAATCVRPKYCSVCGLTEGTTVAHQWVEANYNSPRTCAICGATEGTALATYESANNNFNYSLATGSEQNYSTITGYDNRIANGTVTVLSYNKYTSDSTHAAREGYEWREIKVKFSMDKACRVMWGYTDVYSGLSEYAKTNYITYADGTREKVEATQSFSTEIVTPAVTGGTTPSPTPTTEPTPSPTPSPTAAATASATSAAASPSPVTAPQITPSPTPTPVPTPESEPGKYVSYVTQAVQVPVKYDGLVFYVCNADYESDHRVDDTFQFMKMN